MACQSTGILSFLIYTAFSRLTSLKPRLNHVPPCSQNVQWPKTVFSVQPTIYHGIQGSQQPSCIRDTAVGESVLPQAAIRYYGLGCPLSKNKVPLTQVQLCLQDSENATP